jgi:hypothetical protein
VTGQDRMVLSGFIEAKPHSNSRIPLAQYRAQGAGLSPVSARHNEAMLQCLSAGRKNGVWVTPILVTDGSAPLTERDELR